MYKGIHANGYFLKGKVRDIITTTGQGLELDLELEKCEKEISEFLTKKISTEKKPQKKKVYFFTWEGDWLESGKAKNQTEFTLTELPYTPAEFKKADMKWKKEDAKELARPMKEESYE